MNNTNNFGGSIFLKSNYSEINSNCFYLSRITIQRDNTSGNSVYFIINFCDMKFCSIYKCGSNDLPGSYVTILLNIGLYKINDINNIVLQEIGMDHHFL